MRSLEAEQHEVWKNLFLSRRRQLSYFFLLPFSPRPPALFHHSLLRCCFHSYLFCLLICGRKVLVFRLCLSLCVFLNACFLDNYCDVTQGKLPTTPSARCLRSGCLVSVPFEICESSDKTSTPSVFVGGCKQRAKCAVHF